MSDTELGTSRVTIPTHRGEELTPVSMSEAVGYPQIPCESLASVEGAVVLKNHRLFLLTDRYGNVVPPGRCGLGLFHDDTRVLSYLQLAFRGGLPALLSTQVLRPYASQIDLAVSDVAFGGSAWDPKHAVHIRRETVVDGEFLERVTLTNYLYEPLEFWVELALGADFADVFEVRGWLRPRRGQFYAPRMDDQSVLLAYRGLDGRLMRSRVQFSDPPVRFAGRWARWELTLPPSEPQALMWEVRYEEEEDPTGAVWCGIGPSLLERRRGELHEAYSRWRAECSQWSSDSTQFDTTLRRAVDDIRALYIGVDGGRVISGGIPWYTTVFGRDSIITSYQMLSVNPAIAVDTLRFLARRQGERENPHTEEQPGKILHELRRGEMARSGEIPHVPYFGTVDATPLFVMLLHETWRWTRDDGLVRELMPNLRRALDWIDTYGDIDGDGFIEYRQTSEGGLRNQGWKDSTDGVPFPDGTPAEPPIALVEVQGYVYDAQLRAAALLERFGDPGEAARLRELAEALRRQVLDCFWLDDLGTFALALDGAKRPVPTVTSNAGHLLWTRVATPEQAARVADTLLAPDMFSGWGIRTLSARHPAFNPMSYHNGSIWPHDNALVVLGLAQYGMGRRAHPVLSALQETAAQVDFQRLPELYCGIQRAMGNRPVLYPVSCSPQAWASGALFLMLQAVLGIVADAPVGLLHIRDPILPEFLRELTISGLLVGRSRVSLRFARHHNRTLVNVLDVEGDPIQVRIELG